ncbi:MAG TPA: SOS response-associated peptidase [Stellaceae bacterium]|nr:SOS response-associated peptidase [Stellaceae bacterium]
MIEAVMGGVMCGRARLSSDPDEIAEAFGIAPGYPLPNLQPNWNLAPTQDLAIVRHHPTQRVRRLDVARWGLIPSWARDIKIGFSTFNARCEGIEDKPAFRDAFRARRCLIPLDGFYEWKKRGKEREPYAIALREPGREPEEEPGMMALAGLWEIWRSPAGETVRSTTIVTCPANPLLVDLHERMPVILPPAAWGAWLGETPVGAAALKALLAPYPAEAMARWPVDKRVGDVKHNGPGLIEPAMALL